jgi:hypothetical protein
MRRLVRSGCYVVTLHGWEEMAADDLTLADVETCILTGTIEGRQRDHDTGELKYIVAGSTVTHDSMVAVVKFGAAGNLAIITVYRPR